MKTFLIGSALIATLTLSCGSSQEVASSSNLHGNAPTTCSIKTYFGRYLTAVGGGGHTYDAIHADATKVQAWEKFTLIDIGDGDSKFYIKTSNGYYLTAVGGGGRIRDVIHTNVRTVSENEKFKLWSLGGGTYTIQTANGRYLGHAGQSPDVLHSDATVAKNWEKFQLKCGL